MRAGTQRAAGSHRKPNRVIPKKLVKDNVESVTNEIKLLTSLDHPNIVRSGQKGDRQAADGVSLFAVRAGQML
jgi:serine/threonine protein kinase